MFFIITGSWNLSSLFLSLRKTALAPHSTSEPEFGWLRTFRYEEYIYIYIRLAYAALYLLEEFLYDLHT